MRDNIEGYNGEGTPANTTSVGTIQRGQKALRLGILVDMEQSAEWNCVKADICVLFKKNKKESSTLPEIFSPFFLNGFLHYSTIRHHMNKRTKH